MGRLARGDFERLGSDAGRFDARSRSNLSFLEDALAAIDETDDPIAGLRLLAALWHSPFANRPQPREALGAVGSWLERRLRQEPAVDSEQLTTEIGWLKRLIRSRAQESQNHNPGSRPYQDKPTRPPRRPFGNDIERLEKLRGQQRNKRRRPIKTKKKSAPAVTELPACFEVGFESLPAARNARRIAKKAHRRGREAKEALLNLVPVQGQLQALTTGLVCSTTRTSGFDEVFGAIETNAGRPVAFFALDVGKSEENQLLAGRLVLEPPAEAGSKDPGEKDLTPGATKPAT